MSGHTPAWNPHVTSRARLDHLLDRLTHTLPSIPGFETLSFFGSLADGTADGYSDLDLIVTTSDLSMARSQVLSILEEVDQVEFCWLFPPHRDEWNAIVVFADEGYYHRADLGLVSVDAKERTIAVEQTTLLAQAAGHRSGGLTRQSHAYAPPRRSVGHFLLAQFLGGGIRYAKARKRDQVTTCFRFVAVAAEWCLRAWYAELTGDHSLDRKLSTVEYQTLDPVLTTEQKALVFRELDASSPQAMDRAVKTTLNQLLVHGHSLTAAKGESLDESVFERMLSFLGHEL